MAVCAGRCLIGLLVRTGMRWNLHVFMCIGVAVLALLIVVVVVVASRVDHLLRLLPVKLIRAIASN
jgi:hypothetical protein